MPFIAPPYTDQRRIGVFLPLPSGEVAMPLGIDGEGGVGGGVLDAPQHNNTAVVIHVTLRPLLRA